MKMIVSHSSITIWSWQDNVIKRFKDGLLFLFVCFLFFSCYSLVYCLHKLYNNWGASRQWTSTFDYATQNGKEPDTFCYRNTRTQG